MHVPKVAGVRGWTERQIEQMIKEADQLADEDFKNRLPEEQINGMFKEAGWPDELSVAGEEDRGTIVSGDIAITNEQGHLTEEYIEAMGKEAEREEDRQAVELMGEWIEVAERLADEANGRFNGRGAFSTERYTDGDKKVKERVDAKDAPDGYIYSTSPAAEDTGVNQSRLTKDQIEAMIKETAWFADEIFKAPTEEQVEESRKWYAAPTKEQIEDLIKGREQMRKMGFQSRSDDARGKLTGNEEIVKKRAQSSTAPSWAPGSRASITPRSSTS